MELAPARKHSACISSLISLRPADRRTWQRGMRMRATAMVRTNSKGSKDAALASGVPATRTKLIDGNAFRVHGQGCENVQELGPILRLLAHTDNPTAADVHPGIAHRLKRVEPILISAGADDFLVIPREVSRL